MQKVIYSIIVVAFLASAMGCTPKAQTPAQQVVTVQQFNQRIGDLEKRLKALEDVSPALAKTVADLKKDLEEIKLRVALVEIRPLPSGLSPEEKASIDSMEKRVKALEPTPKPAITPTPTPTPTPVASAAALTALEKRVETLEKQVQQQERRVTPTPTLTPTPTPSPAPDLRVAKHSADYDILRTRLTISGEVVNLGNATATSVSVIATLYKIDSTVLGGKTGTPLATTLAPGERAPFTITILSTEVDITRYASYDVRATRTTQ